MTDYSESPLSACAKTTMAVRRVASRSRCDRDALRALGATLSLICVLLATTSAAAQAGTPYVDGISDQSLQAWDSGFNVSYFGGYFSTHWVAAGHIKYARYVVPVSYTHLTLPTKRIV